MHIYLVRGAEGNGRKSDLGILLGFDWLARMLQDLRTSCEFEFVPFYMRGGAGLKQVRLLLLMLNMLNMSGHKTHWAVEEYWREVNAMMKNGIEFLLFFYFTIPWCIVMHLTGGASVLLSGLVQMGSLFLPSFPFLSDSCGRSVLGLAEVACERGSVYTPSSQTSP